MSTSKSQLTHIKKTVLHLPIEEGNTPAATDLYQNWLDVCETQEDLQEFNHSCEPWKTLKSACSIHALHVEGLIRAHQNLEVLSYLDLYEACRTPQQAQIITRAAEVIIHFSTSSKYQKVMALLNTIPDFNDEISIQKRTSMFLISSLIKDGNEDIHRAELQTFRNKPSCRYAFLVSQARIAFFENDLPHTIESLLAAQMYTQRLAQRQTFVAQFLLNVLVRLPNPEEAHLHLNQYMQKSLSPSIKTECYYYKALIFLSLHRMDQALYCIQRALTTQKTVFGSLQHQQFLVQATHISRLNGNQQQALEYTSTFDQIPTEQRSTFWDFRNLLQKYGLAVQAGHTLHANLLQNDLEAYRYQQDKHYFPHLLCMQLEHHRIQGESLNEDLVNQLDLQDRLVVNELLCYPKLKLALEARGLNVQHIQMPSKHLIEMKVNGSPCLILNGVEISLQKRFMMFSFLVYLRLFAPNQTATLEHLDEVLFNTASPRDLPKHPSRRRMIYQYITNWHDALCIPNAIIVKNGTVSLNQHTIEWNCEVPNTDGTFLPGCYLEWALETHKT